jgi:transposase
MVAARGRPLTAVTVGPEDREVLERWARRPSSAQALALRCRIVLAAADGLSNVEIAERLGCNRITAGKWRARFVAEGLDGLWDEPRPGAPRTIGDADVERVIVATLEQTPRDAPHWSTRSMAAATGMSQSAVSRIWRAFGLKPHHQVESFKLSPDPQFIDKVRDVVGLYLNPPDAALVLCVDEKTQIQALDRTSPILPMLPGTRARATHDYVRHGTTNLYAALDVASGNVLTSLTVRHRAEEFRRFLAPIDRAVPADLAVHLVVDNNSTHKTPTIKRWLERHPRFVLHLTPTYSSWLNLVERWFAELTNRWLRRGAHRSTKELVAAIRTWTRLWNEDPKPFVWHKSADDILESLAQYCQHCQRISDSRHQPRYGSVWQPDQTGAASGHTVGMEGSSHQLHRPARNDSGRRRASRSRDGRHLRHSYGPDSPRWTAESLRARRCRRGLCDRLGRRRRAHGTARRAHPRHRRACARGAVRVAALGGDA